MCWIDCYLHYDLMVLTVISQFVYCLCFQFYCLSFLYAIVMARSLDTVVESARLDHNRQRTDRSIMDEWIAGWIDGYTIGGWSDKIYRLQSRLLNRKERGRG